MSSSSCSSADILSLYIHTPSAAAKANVSNAPNRTVHAKNCRANGEENAAFDFDLFTRFHPQERGGSTGASDDTTDVAAVNHESLCFVEWNNPSVVY